MAPPAWAVASLPMDRSPTEVRANARRCAGAAQQRQLASAVRSPLLRRLPLRVASPPACSCSLPVPDSWPSLLTAPPRLQLRSPSAASVPDRAHRGRLQLRRARRDRGSARAQVARGGDVASLRLAGRPAARHCPPIAACRRKPARCHPGAARAPRRWTGGCRSGRAGQRHALARAYPHGLARLGARRRSWTRRRPRPARCARRAVGCRGRLAASAWRETGRAGGGLGACACARAVARACAVACPGASGVATGATHITVVAARAVAAIARRYPPPCPRADCARPAPAHPGRPSPANRPAPDRARRHAQCVLRLQAAARSPTHHRPHPPSALTAHRASDRHVARRRATAPAPCAASTAIATGGHAHHAPPSCRWA